MGQNKGYDSYLTIMGAEPDYGDEITTTHHEWDNGYASCHIHQDGRGWIDWYVWQGGSKPVIDWLESLGFEFGKIHERGNGHTSADLKRMIKEENA